MDAGIKERFKDGSGGKGVLLLVGFADGVLHEVFCQEGVVRPQLARGIKQELGIHVPIKGFQFAPFEVFKDFL